MSSARGALDPEIAALLLDEIARHSGALADGSPREDVRRALHALRGSTGMAGLLELSEALGRIERRVAAGEDAAVGEARARVEEARAAIVAGRPLPEARSTWPVPPDDLRAGPSDHETARLYAVEMHDRIERLDAALASGASDVEAAEAAFREVHAIKGAALAVGDEATAWFCHGLEERLRAAGGSEQEARMALDVLAGWRGVLAEMIAAPERALGMLREKLAPGSAPPGRPTSAPPSSGPRSGGLERRRRERRERERRQSVAPERASERPGEDASLRVPTTTLDRLFERVRQLDESRSHVTEGAAAMQHEATRARQLRRGLMEALRLIGPPRPWGAPAAAIDAIERTARDLHVLADRLEHQSGALRDHAERVHAEAAAAHGDLAMVRTTRAAWLFDRVAAAISAQARREGRDVRLSCSGGETPIDRRVAEALLDPVLQLARNAVAHGIEPAAERALRGKPRVGSVLLHAEPRGGGLRLRVEDDGAGVDLVDLRARAVALGAIAPDTARAAGDETLLGLLFAPGFTTRETADLLSGRGVGLDLALKTVRRLGGSIRLASRPGKGLTATVDIPVEGGLTRVLWVEAASRCYALPVQPIRRIVLLSADPPPVVPLAAASRSISTPRPPTPSSASTPSARSKKSPSAPSPPS